jgi:LPXTG-motif cell wall-anchored protein
MGIKESGYGTLYDEKVTSYAQIPYGTDYSDYFRVPDSTYTRAVLDPTKENIDALYTYSDHWAILAEEPESIKNYYLNQWFSDYSDYSSSMYQTYAYYTNKVKEIDTYNKNLWEVTGKLLKELLTCKDSDGNDVDPGSIIGHTTCWTGTSSPYDTDTIAYREELGYVENMVTGATNPYQDNFNYVDGAYFGELSTEDLEDIFSKIVNKVTLSSRYDFLLKSGTNVVVTDPLGTGMEVKGEPVLRYFGTNYAVTKKSEGKDGSTTYVDYYWEKTVDREDSDSRADEPTVDLSSIVARVSTDTTTGDQTVTFTIPEEALPSFYPDLARAFYYEELPARLIYKVGLSDAEEQKLKTEYDKTKNVEATYYTNKYGSDGGATVTFEPDKSDPYYENLSGTQTFTKTSNTTETDAYNFSESYNSTTGIVTQKLGNNGVLTLSKDNTVNITVKKQWEEDDTTHPDSVYIGLFGKGTKTDADGNISDFAKMYDQSVLQESNNWEKTWSKINRVQVEDGVTYNYDEFYVCEFVPDGYAASYADGDGNALLENNDTFDVVYYNYVKVEASSIEAMSVEDEDDDSVANNNSVASFNSEVGKSILLANKDGNPVYPPEEEEETSESENGEDVSISPMVAGRYELTKVVEPRPFDVVNATSGTVVITNTSGYTLPNTGGSGKSVTFGAITIMFGALLMYILKRRKEMRS